MDQGQTVRTVLALTPEATAIVDANASERRKGAFVSEVLLQWASEQDAGALGVLERIEGRLARIERLLVRTAGGGDL